MIGRRFRVRPSSCTADRDWSDRGRNSSQPGPVELFNKAWPRLKKHLFNVRTDPEEKFDLVLSQPAVVEELRARVEELMVGLVERDYPAPDRRGRPTHFSNVWSPGWC